MSDIVYPNINVRLTGENGNAFSVLGKVINAMRKAGLTKPQIFEFEKEAMSGNYDNLLQTCMKYVNVE